jgi:hypothetical protein
LYERIAGISETAKRQVVEILGLFGWETDGMGSAEAARAIERLCIPGFRENRWSRAFKLLAKSHSSRVSTRIS